MKFLNSLRTSWRFSFFVTFDLNDHFYQIPDQRNEPGYMKLERAVRKKQEVGKSEVRNLNLSW